MKQAKRSSEARMLTQPVTARANAMENTKKDSLSIRFLKRKHKGHTLSVLSSVCCGLLYPLPLQEDLLFSYLFLAPFTSLRAAAPINPPRTTLNRIW